MSNIIISEDYVNATKGWRTGENPPYETFTDNVGELFLSLQKEHGRCVSKLYQDRPIKPPMCIGWVFRKRMKYDDCKEYFISEVWVTLHEKMPETKTTYYHKELAS